MKQSVVDSIILTKKILKNNTNRVMDKNSVEEEDIVPNRVTTGVM